MIGAKRCEFRLRSYLIYINPPQPGERIAMHTGAGQSGAPESKTTGGARRGGNGLLTGGCRAGLYDQ